MFWFANFIPKAVKLQQNIKQKKFLTAYIYILFMSFVKTYVTMYYFLKILIHILNK